MFPQDNNNNLEQPATPPAAPNPTEPAAPAPSNTPEQPGPTVPAVPKKKKTALVVVLSIVGVLILAGVAVLIWFLTNPSDKKILHDAFDKTLTADGMSIKGHVTASTADVSGTVNIDVAKVGDRARLDADATVEFGAMSVQVGAGAIVDENGDIYVQVKDLDNLLATIGMTEESLGGVDIAQLSDQWIRIDSSTLGDVTATTGVETDATMECFTSLLSDVRNDAEVRKSLITAVQDSEFFVATRNGKEKIDGRSAYRYDLTVDLDNSTALSDNLVGVGAIETFTECIGVTDTSSAVPDLEVSTNSPSVTFSFWVDRATHEPTRFLVNASNDDWTVEADFIVKLNPTDVFETPTNYIELTELMEGFMGGVNLDTLTGSTDYDYTDYGDYSNFTLDDWDY